MLTAGSIALAGLISLGLFFWRLTRLIDAKIIAASYESGSDGEVLVITEQGVLDPPTHDRRNALAVLWLFAQQLVLVTPLAYVLGGIRHSDWTPWDGGAVILVIVFLGAYALHRAHTRKQPSPQSGQRNLAYNQKLVEGLAWSGVLFVALAMMSQAYWLIIVSLLCVVGMIAHLVLRPRQSVPEDRPDA